MSGSPTRPLLVELLVEELPPKSLRALGDAFADGLARGLAEARLRAADAPVQAFASPRRLAALLSDVRSIGEATSRRDRLMPAGVGLDASGAATPALRKRLVERFGYAANAAEAEWAAAVRDRIVRESDGKAEQLFHQHIAPGLPLQAALQEALDAALQQLPLAKRMTYQLQDGWSSVVFARPAHGLVALHGSEPVAVSALGLQAGDCTAGHRFEAAAPVIRIAHAAAYEAQLRDEGAVIASFDARRAEVARQLADAAAREGLAVADDAALLDEVSALVERPNVLLCRFDEAFLAVPPECLVLTMKANQKYFPLLDGAGRLTNRFLVVSNIRPADPGRIVEGNERVVRPRLADARFFYDQDRKRPLASRLDGLDRVVYHGKLGSQRARVERVRQIARAIARASGVDGAEDGALAVRVDRAALLAKCDLQTDMVAEFPELQGVMGGYYARHDGEDAAVAHAIEDHYKPRFAGDTLPRERTGTVLALADKLETLAGLFGIGAVPTGDRDPFALRRHALGVIRMLIEQSLPLPLPWLLESAFEVFPGASAQAPGALATFFDDRLAGLLREQGWTAREIDSVTALRPPRWADFPQRLLAVRAFSALPEAASLAAANKRVGNILRKSQGVGDSDSDSDSVDPTLFAEPAETALGAALSATAPQAERAFESGDYTGALVALAALKAPVDAFFDSVMVNSDDPALRRNRLALLARLHAAMNRVADLSRLAT